MSFDPSNPPRRQILDDDGAPHAYSLTPFAGREGWSLATRLFALAGAPLGKILDSVLTEGSQANLDLGAAVRELSGALVGGQSDALVLALLRNAIRDGIALDNPVAFDRAYQANFGELAEVLIWVVEVNGFVNFFGRLLTRATASGAVSRFQSGRVSSTSGSGLPTA